MSAQCVDTHLALLCCVGCPSHSGFEGAWVTTPTKWTNQYFRNLLHWNWEVHVGPGGHHQWRPQHKPSATAAEKAEPLPDIMSESPVRILDGQAAWVAGLHEKVLCLRSFKRATVDTVIAGVLYDFRCVSAGTHACLHVCVMCVLPRTCATAVCAACSAHNRRGAAA